MVQLFGYEIKRKNEKPLESFAPELKDDGAVVVAAGGAYGTFVDLAGTARTESELVAKYREISLQPELGGGNHLSHHFVQLQYFYQEHKPKLPLS